MFIWFLELIEIDKILKRNEKCVCLTASQTNAVDGKDNDDYHQKGEGGRGIGEYLPNIKPDHYNNRHHTRHEAEYVQ